MKDYKRLTEKSVDCFRYCLKDHKAKIGEFNNYEAFFDYSMAVKRLGELEDKIEREELDYVAGKDKQIASLSEENERLRAENAKIDEYGCVIADISEQCEQLKAENDNLTVELEVAQRDVENLTRTLDEANDEIKALEAENAELKEKNIEAERPRIKQHIQNLQFERIASGLYTNVSLYGECPKSQKISLQDANQLMTENAKLKARLKNAVELPCRVGDMVYVIRENGVQELQVKSIELVDYGSANKYVVRCSRVAKDDFIYLADNVYRVCWFTDRKEAETKLVEEDK